MAKGAYPAFFGKKDGDSKSKGPMASALANFKKKGAFGKGKKKK